ncbi:MAG: class I SAM-dependent methyltransferase [Syntrophomonadaceae bacterium]|jgi:SAM-dependent methyltransferase
MDKGFLVNSVTIARRLAQEVIQPGDIAVDATCGNGHDTLLLARLVGQKGKVYAFDIQPEAIERSRALLRQDSLEERIVFINDCHSKIDLYVEGKPRFCMFNLGYLPGGDHSIKTDPIKVVQALDAINRIMTTGGIITIVLYPGHPGGKQEVEIIRNHLTCLPQVKFEISEVCFINQINNPPRLMVIYKKGEFQ